MGKFAAKAARGRFANKVITTYKAYLDNPEIAKQDNPVTNRPKTQPLFLLPFIYDLPSNFFYQASASEPVISQYLSDVNTGGTRARETLTVGTQFPLQIAKFQPARIFIRTGRRSEGTRTISKTSGLPYKYYGGRSVSIPFGKANNTETLTEAFETIKAAILQGTSPTTAPLVTYRFEKRR